jgi:hypothetical protein
MYCRLCHIYLDRLGKRGTEYSGMQASGETESGIPRSGRRDFIIYTGKFYK